MKFQIKRKTWQRGERSDSVKLLNTETGKMCCLGFFSLACGIPEEQIKDIPGPQDIVREIGHVPACLQGIVDLVPMGRSIFVCTDLGAQLVRTNDTEGLDDSLREQELTRLFASIGHEVEFIDG